MKNYLLSLLTLAISFTFSFSEASEYVISDTGRAVVSSSDILPDANESTLKISKQSDVNLKTSLLKHFNLPTNDALFHQNINLVPFTATNSPTPQNDFHCKRAEDLMAKVKSENRFVKYLDASALIDLPIGIVSEGGKEDYAILVDSLVITPTHAYLTVYMCIPIPQSDKKMVFRGDNIRLSKDAGITGDARVFMVNDVAFDLFGENSKMTIRGGADKTFALWDCGGFKEATIFADVEFSRNWIVPLEGDKNVMSSFKTIITDWNNLVVNVAFEPFSLTSMKGVEFHTSSAVFDFSDFYTPEQIQFPKDYSSPQFISGDKRLWRGFYMQNLKIVLPPEFEKKGEQSRISFDGQNMLLDNMGFSGSVGVKNLFTISQGNMNSWDYSLDSIGLSFVANELTGAGFKGKIVLPIGQEDKPFAYNAIINPGTSYVFNVSTLDALNFDIWKAKVILEKGSYLDVQVSGGKFKPKAVLTGSMDVTVQKDEMSLFDVEFQELTISTESPYLDAKLFSFGSEKLENSLKGFPISISRIGFKKTGDAKVALFFNIAVHLTGDDDGGFAGDATFDLNSKMDPVVKKWKYDGVSISELGIDIDGGSYRMKGRLKIFDVDPIYGKGFNGTAELFFQPGFELSGTVIFGKVNNYRYWYADAFVGLPQGIPFCGFLAFYGFGGGMYHNMEQVGFSKDQKYGAGMSLSGVVYKPNNDIRYGFKATIQIGLTSAKETFNGDATFEISFHKKGGVNAISLLGNAYVLMDQALGDVSELTAMVDEMSQHKDSYGESDGDMRMTSGLKPPGKDAMISGHVFVKYDFLNDVLHGEMEMYVDVFGALKGIGPGGLAGWSVIHYSREEWYIYIGTPDRRVGLSVLGMMKMDGYFMLGDEIPGSPPPPAQVSRILGDIDLDYMRDENALGTGKGIAFGASFAFDTGDQKFMMFYGRFAMGAGFDVMLKNYGNYVRCKGRSSTMGINGWYANGQTYAYVEGKIGIRVKIFFKTKKIEILRLGAAVVFQAKLPNPVWMRGIVGGRFSVLGGLVKGHCRFEVEIGDKCEIIDGSVLEGLAVIADITPMSGGKEIDVFTTPQAVFNFEIDKEFQMVDVDDVKKTFRIKLDHFTIKSENEIYEGDLTWNQDKTVLVFDNYEVLAPKKELTAEVKIVFEEKVNGKWDKVKLKGEVVFEEMKTVFTTGEAPDYIPHANIAYCYPQLNQYNFYQKEYSEGYIKLKKGQDYLFNLPEVWVQKGKFISSSGNVQTTNIAYSNNQVNFAIPTKLLNEQAYTFEIVNLPKDANAGMDANITSVSTKIDGMDAEITSKKASGNLVKLEETKIFSSTLRTSKNNTFLEKLNNMNISRGWSSPDSRGQAIHILGTNIIAEEYFDVLELKGTSEHFPLVTIVANLDDNKYYQNTIYPFVYKDYPSLTVPPAKLDSRDLSLGVPPIKAVYILQTPQFDRVPSVDISSANIGNQVRGANFSYELVYYMKLDYQDLRAKTARYYAYRNDLLNDRRRKILETPFPVVTQGNYQVDIAYTLPGINKVTTRKSYNIYNPFK